MISYPEDIAPPTGLTASHLKHLSKYLSPSYLNAETLERLAGQFVAGSEVVMYNFLKPELAASIKAELSEIDKQDYAPYVQDDGKRIVPEHATGESQDWKLEGPPSKHRYLTLQPGATSTRTPIMQSVATDLYPSEAFRAWLSVVSSLVPLSYRAEARRFRKGLDYTLANGEEREAEPRLDGVLGLSWWAKDESEETEDEQDVGGWECYLAPPDVDEDPAVYQSAAAKKASKGTDEDTNNMDGATAEAQAESKPTKPTNGEGPKITMGGVELEFDESQLSPSDFDTDSEGGDMDDDDGPLLHLGLGFNKFLLVLRDPGVMRFVKYLSNSADGSRWDVCGEWDVGQLEEDEDEAEVDGQNGDEAK